jgi:AcrR family transcriptional regulator
MRKNRGTKESIVFAAANIFAEKGFYGASLRDIGAACNVTDPTIYHYFENKEKLFEKTITTTQAIYFLVLRRAVITGRDLRTELSSYFYAMTEWGSAVRKSKASYIEASIAHVFELYHAAPADMRPVFRRRFQLRIARRIENTLRNYGIKKNHEEIVSFFTTILWGFTYDISAMLGDSSGAGMELVIKNAVEQTMQLIAKKQKQANLAALEDTAAEWQAKFHEIRNIVRERMRDYPQKVYSFMNFRQYMRYGQPI